VINDTHQGRPALVARVPAFACDHGRYLLQSAGESVMWVDDPELATIFPAMADAICAAFNLPRGLAAYAVLRQPEVDIHRKLSAPPLRRAGGV
jgi:hypothetical protein